MGEAWELKRSQKYVYEKTYLSPNNPTHMPNQRKNSIISCKEKKLGNRKRR